MSWWPGPRYGGHHRWLRKRWKRRLVNAWALGQPGLACWRCRQPILKDDVWHLGHYDDTQIHAGPEHQACNLARRPTRHGGCG
jgi:hypothetical protein